MAFNVFYMRGGEVHTYLSEPVPEAVARESAQTFENKYYNKQYPSGRGAYNVSRPWVGRV